MPRWDLEMLFADGKEEWGRDPSPLMSASAMLRLWTLALLASVLLEEAQHRLRALWQRPLTMGEARREIPHRHRRRLLAWLHEPFLSGAQPAMLCDLFAA